MKDAIAITQENADSIGVAIRGDDIKFTIAIYIAQGHGAWTITRGEVCVETKGAIAIAQENADSIGVAIRGDYIKFTIAIYIAQGYGVWISSRGEICFG